MYEEVISASKILAISRFHHLIQLRNRIFLSFFFFFFFLELNPLFDMSSIAQSEGVSSVFGVFAQVMSSSYPPQGVLLHVGLYMCLCAPECVCVCLYECAWVFVCVCNGSYLCFLQSTETNKYEELRTSQSLIQIPVVCQRTSGVIISQCLIVHLSSLSLPVVSLTYGLLIFKAADILKRNIIQ